MAHFAMPPKTYRGTERARQLVERLPSLVAGYHKTIERDLKALTDPAAVAQAREALRTLIVNAEIRLQPNDDHTAAVGELHLVDLGEHVMQFAGLQRKPDMHGRLVAGAGVSTLLMSISRLKRA